MTAWIDSADVAAYLGRDLSDVEASQVDAAIDAACSQIEGVCGLRFGTAALVDEIHDVYGNMIYLGRPVASITSVKLRTLLVGSSALTLQASQYELLSPLTGRILLQASYGEVALVSYTPATVPADVILATTLLVAGYQAPTGDPNRSADNLKSYSVGQELTVAFKDDSTESVMGLPASVAHLLSPYIRVVIA